MLIKHHRFEGKSRFKPLQRKNLKKKLITVEV